MKYLINFDVYWNMCQLFSFISLYLDRQFFRFNWFLPSFTQLYLVLPSFTEFYRVGSSFIWFYLLCYLVNLSFTDVT